MTLSKSAPRLMHIHLGDKGGAEKFFVHLVNGLAERGVSQIALTRPRRAWRHEIEAVCPVHEFRYSRSFLKMPVLKWRIDRLARSFGADAVLAWMAPAARWVPAPWPGLRTAVRLGDFPEALNTFGQCRTIICNTPEIARRCTAMGWPADRAEVISNFTDMRLAEPIARAELMTPDDAFVIVAMGRFVKRKGFHTLIDALARVDNAILWLLGEGEERAALEAQARSLGIWERIRMPGWAAAPDRYLRVADVFCCPSIEEPLGNVVLEAWAQEVPIVATASEGPSWLIEHEKDGLLTPLADSEALADAFSRLRTDPALAKTLTQAGKQKLATQFGREAVLDKYMTWMQS